MTTLAVQKVGLVAHYSHKGNWAFRLAFGISLSHRLQLNIFHFLESPYNLALHLAASERPERAFDEKHLIAKDRELREYYDKYLGDYTEVGFRVCVSARHEMELHECLMHREYQLLVIPYTNRGDTFTNMPIEDFAYQFIAPTILVGPEDENEYHINPQAIMVIESLGLPEEMPEAMWMPIG